jgi:CHAD domain-containing protein
MTVTEAFRVVARGCLDDIAAHHDATCQGDADALHQTRIALTRLRSLVSFFPAIAAQPRWARLRGELKWLNGYLGPARDMDVAMAASAAAKGARPTAGNETTSKAWADSHRRLERALRSQRYRRLVADLSRWIGQDRPTRAAAGNESVADHAARKLARWHKRLLKRSRHIASMDADDQHRLRLRTKRFRYAVEFCEGLCTGKPRARQQAMLKHLRKAQAALGHLNDMENRRTLSPPQGAADAKENKRATRLMDEAEAAYRKMEKIKPFWE